MKDLREAVGTKACIVGNMDWMKLAGHMVRMKDKRLPKRSETKKQEGCRKRGRPHLRWEHCGKKDLRKAGRKKVEKKGQQQGPTEQIT